MHLYTIYNYPNQYSYNLNGITWNIKSPTRVIYDDFGHTMTMSFGIRPEYSTLTNYITSIEAKDFKGATCVDAVNQGYRDFILYDNMYSNSRDFVEVHVEPGFDTWHLAYLKNALNVCGEAPIYDVYDSYY
jgi:hypothetical protein